MFSGNAESQFAKLPTLVQYCKQNKFSAEKGVKLVTTIWLPNKFESISFDTESYRLRIDAKAGFYQDLLHQLSAWEDEEACLFLRITSAEKFAYIIDVLPDETCTWEHLGEFGRKLTVNQRKRKGGKRVSQNPSSLAADRKPLTLLDVPEEVQEGASEV